MTMVLETDYKISKDLIWLAEGYKHRVPHNSESDKDTAQPYEHDSFTLFPRESVPTYAEILIDTPEVLQHTSRRVHSATERSSHFRQGRPGTAPVTRPTGRPPSGRKYGWAGNYDRSAASSRPGSGYRPASVASGETTPTRRRVQSAGSIAARTRAIAKMRQGFTLVNRLYENDVISQNISLHPVSPAPDYKYFDRHSRCHDHTHMHDDLLRDRPQTACAGEPCGGFSRPGSASSQRSRLTDAETMSQPQRYINYHRPKTAPATRREWRSLPRTHFLFRGKQPKFCNIVQQVQLHAREAAAKSNADDIGADDSDYDGVDYLQKSIDGDQLLRKWRQQSESSISVTEPEAETEVTMETPPPTEEKDSGGMDGRPGSPEVEDDVSKFKDLPSEVVSPSPPVPPLRDLEPLEVKVPPSPPDSKLLRRFTPTRMPFHRTLSLSIATGEVDLTKLIDEDIDKSKLPSSNKETKKPYQPPTLFIPAVLGPSEQTEGHGDTPAQPPPSPEVPKEPEEVKVTEPPPEPKKRIRSANKKSKKPINRTKTKPKEVEVKKEEEPKPETPPSPPPELNKKDYEVHIAIPDLPEFKEKEKTPPKEKKKPQKHAIVIPKFEPPKEDLLFDEDLRLRLQQLDFSMEPQSPEDTPKKQKAAWVTGRLALSQQSSRFELPMDMKVLETMTTQDYIKKYCKITKRRQKLYNDVFRRSSKTKDRSQYIPFNELEKAMKDVMVNTITSEHMKLLVDILQLNEDTFIDSELFSAIAALAERLLYPQFVTQETVDRQDYKKEKIECADFSALEWKFHGVDVNPAIRRLLTTIC